MRVGLTIIILLVFSGCYNSDALFVSTKNKQDTLILTTDNHYLRNVTFESIHYSDSGTWYHSEDRIYLRDWKNRGALNPDFFSDDPGLACFSFKTGFMTNEIQRVFFDVDDYYYFEKLKGTISK